MMKRSDGTQVVGGKHVHISHTITRPTDTTQYSARDVVANATSSAVVATFTDCGSPRIGSNGASGLIRSATLIHSSYVSTGPDFLLFLFTVSPTTQQDNAKLAVTDADLLNCIGTIPFTTWVIGKDTGGAGGSQIDYEKDVNLVFECADDDRDLYGIMIELSTYTPVNGESFKIVLNIDQD